MSTSSLSNGPPADATLEQALRKAVQQIYKSGDLENLTIRRLRKVAEEDLDLDDDFFKIDPIWKEKSKNVIQAEVDAHTSANPNSQQASSQLAAKEDTPVSKPQKTGRKVQGTKRASTEKARPEKRRKKSASDRNTSESIEDKPTRKKPTSKAENRASTSSLSPPPKQEIDAGEAAGVADNNFKSIGDVSKQSESEKLVNQKMPKSKKRNEDEKRKETSNNTRVRVDGDVEGSERPESELSEVFDEEPKSKGRKNGSAKPKAKKSEVLKGRKAAEHVSDPDTEEIKRLQGWLVKCGIRKMWYKELRPYDTSKPKIRHLKDMLAEAGMTGRYSNEKAAQIKDERELKAELEAVQQGNKQWGKVESEAEEESTGKPRKKLARGLQGLDFLNDDDGEETD